MLQYYLGKVEDHTVYKAELVEVVPRVELHRKEARILRETIGLDNTLAITAMSLVGTTSGHYLVNMVHAGIRAVKKETQATMKANKGPGGPRL